MHPDEELTQESFAALRPKLMPTEDGQPIRLYSIGAIYRREIARYGHVLNLVS